MQTTPATPAPIFTEPAQGTPQKTESNTSNTGKKILATILIVLFSLLLLSANAELSKEHRSDWAYLLGQLVSVALIITGLIFSIKWQVKLSGHINTSGRQAVAIFLGVFCCWGLLLVVLSLAMSATSTSAILFLVPLVMGAAYIGGLYLAFRWLKKLRRSERSASPPSARAATIS
jgi:hypothetical protein